MSPVVPIHGKTYRHRKHAPEAGKYHEYEIIGIVHPNTESTESTEARNIRTHWHFPAQYRHTGTDQLITLIGCGTKIYADVTESHVAYKNTQPDKCDPDWIFCLRPLSEFTAKKFKLIED